MVAYSAKQREQIRHYMRHSDQKCSQCNAGFNLVWLTVKEDRPRGKKVGQVPSL